MWTKVALHSIIAPCTTQLHEQTKLTYLKSRRIVRKNTLGKDFPPEARNVPNIRTGHRTKGSLVKYTRNEIPATTTAQVYAIVLE